MSSSSDIEKLFDHFGGDANAYQEIGRENEARSARTRWPLLVTLDLTQPTIPAIGQRREASREPLANNAQAALEPQDTTPKDAVAVTRAKAPLFTRSHRRDIPPVVAAVAQPAAPRGASRFGSLETDAGAVAQAAPVAARAEAMPPAASQPAPAVAPLPISPSPVAAQVTTAPVAPVMPPASIAPLAHTHAPAAQPVIGLPPNVPTPRAGIPAFAPRAAAPAPIPAPASAPTWAQPVAAPAPAWTQAPAPTYTTAASAPKPPASILGKLFVAAPEPAPRQAAAPAGQAAPLQSVFDRLRGTPAHAATHASTQAAAAPAAAANAAPPAVSNSWLVNGPRRS